MLAIFVINLDGSNKRLQNVEAQLAQHQLSFERVSAVDGRLMSEEALHQHYCSKLNQKQYYKALTPGEVGCYLSHRKVWQLIVERKLKAAVVLEDDFVLEKGLEDAEELVESVHFDYIKLSDHPSRPRKTQALKTVGYSQVVRFDKLPARTCAQIVSFEGAKKLLASSEKFGRPVDIDLQFWWEKSIDPLGLQPFPFTPAPDVASDITAVQSRDSVKKHRLRRLKQQLMFKFNNAIRKPKTDFDR